MLATEYAQYYGIPAQGEGETDLAFRTRVSGVLRAKGLIIEAHEAYQDSRYEEGYAGSADVMTGVMGAMALALSDRDYGVDGARQVGDDIAAGIIARHPEAKYDPLVALLASMLS
jgi:hypothetical protein